MQGTDYALAVRHDQIMSAKEPLLVLDLRSTMAWMGQRTENVDEGQQQGEKDVDVPCRQQLHRRRDDFQERVFFFEPVERVSSTS